MNKPHANIHGKSHRVDEVRTIRQEAMDALEDLLVTLRKQPGFTLEAKLNERRTKIHITDASRSHRIVYTADSVGEACLLLSGYAIGHDDGYEVALKPYTRLVVHCTGNLYHLFVQDANDCLTRVEHPQLPAFSKEVVVGIAAARYGNIMISFME